MDKIFLSFNDICVLIIAFIFPPLAVIIKRGCSSDLVINIILTIFLYFAAIIHAVYITITTRDEYTQLRNNNADESSEQEQQQPKIPDNSVAIIIPYPVNFVPVSNQEQAQTSTETAPQDDIPTNLPPPPYVESEEYNKEQNNLNQNFNSIPEKH